MSISIDTAKLTEVRQRNNLQQSYNIEMTELMGGTFWKPYTPEQVAGTEEFPTLLSYDELIAANSYGALMTKMDPINLYEPRIRTCAKALGTVIIRYSGSWATCAYYDFDGHTNGNVPDGFATVLTAEQWRGALDFAKAAGAKILVSLANCYGVHRDGKYEWTPDQAKLLWDFTEAYGMKIDYAEFMNQPDVSADSMLPEGYTMQDFCRDHDLFAKWLKENHPETTLVGLSCSLDVPRIAGIMPSGMQFVEYSKLMLGGMEIKPDVFSCHSYTGSSERLASINGNHFQFSQTLTEEYLGTTMDDLTYYASVRDEFIPNGEVWVTESGDAYGGGDTWASTFVECFRYIDEQCRFAKLTKGVIFHNTFASSAYGFLDIYTHLPRPQYWAALLFNQLAGTTVYETGEPLREGVHLYAFSRADGKQGACYIYLNNSQTDAITLNVPKCTRYTLSSDRLRSEKIFLNGKELKMVDDNTMPELNGQDITAGELTLAPCTITYLVV